MDCPTCSKIDTQKYFDEIRNRLKGPKFQFNFSIYRPFQKKRNEGATFNRITGIYDNLEQTSDQLSFWTETPLNETIVLTEQRVLESCPELLIDFYERNLALIDMDGSIKHQVQIVAAATLDEEDEIMLEHTPKEIHYVKYQESVLFYLTSWNCECLPQWIPSVTLRKHCPKLLAGYLKKIIVWV